MRGRGSPPRVAGSPLRAALLLGSRLAARRSQGCETVGRRHGRDGAPGRALLRGFPPARRDMKAVFGGGEVPVYRELMYERGVLHQSSNYVSHRRRVMSTDWLIADHFPADVEVFVDSGARTFNRPGGEVTGREIEEIASDYYRFVDNNIDRIAGYLEFDARQLEDAKRDARLLYVDPNKGIVVWHAEDG